MPHAPSHRGPHPEDAQLFAPAAVPRLREATADLSWLLTRRYALPGALQVVGNRYALDQRQRKAITRSACTDGARDRRRAAEVPVDALRGATLLVDGYNALTTLEAALGGAVVLHGRDGAFRDIAGVHGTYRHVEETIPALRLVGEVVMGHWGVGQCVWHLDEPVSNSGRLRATILHVAHEAGWRWGVKVVPDPDPVLAEATEGVVATADAEILDRCRHWAALTRGVVQSHIPTARVVDLRV
jgi:hypothetical protein